MMIADQDSGSTPPTPDGSRAQIVIRILVLPFVALTIGILVQQAYPGRGVFDPPTWGHWDSGHYLRIARVGSYTLTHCGPPRFAPGSYCGSAGWMPLYPYTLRFLHLFGLHYDSAGVWTSLSFWFGILSLLGWMLRRTQIITTLTVLTLAAVWPGQIYFHAIFPVSMAVFFLLLAIHLAISRDRIVAPGLAAAAGAASYSTGFWLAPVLGLWKLISGSGSWKPRLARATTLGVISAMGLLAVLGLQKIQTGSALAFFRVLSRYGTGFHNPIETLGGELAPLWGKGLSTTYVTAKTPAQARTLRRFAVLTAIQELFVLTLVGLGIGVFLRKNRSDPGDLLLAIYAAVFVISPLIAGSAISPYRTQATLLPTVFLTRHLPTAMQVALIMVAALLARAMAPYFFTNLMV